MSGRHRARGHGSAHPLRLRIFGALGVLACCLATFGILRGAIASVVAVPIALAALARLQRRQATARIDESLPMALDLVAAGLRAGRAPADALGWAAAAATGEDARRFAHVATMLRAGHDPEAAWAAVRGGPLEEVARVTIRSASSGARLATAYEQLARRLRAEITSAALARAHRASVLVMAPIGLCFLPAFVCLGIVPVLVGITRTVLTGLP